MTQKLRVGIIGFGLSGRYFFSPFIEAYFGFELGAFVSSQKQEINAQYPNVAVYESVEEFFNADTIDVVIVASPNSTHFNYAKRALLAGKHVIVEKPLTITSIEAEELIQLSKKQNKILAPFQNRRWDGDFLTVKQLIEENKLGDVLEFESHFDRYRPLKDRAEWKMEPIPGNGVTYDLGPHLIDQSLNLFGKPNAVYGDIRIQREQGKVDDYFEIHLLYNELKVILKASVMCREVGPRFIVHGREGSFVKYGLDPQENNLKEGIKPDDYLLGIDNEENYGLLHTQINGEIVRKYIETTAGNYMGYFDNVYHAIMGSDELYVKPEEVKLVLEIIEKAYMSSAKKIVVSV